ncbi:MAG: ClbS/DfsB family four-helix bundle protein [Actinomycetota bacterium]
MKKEELIREEDQAWADLRTAVQGLSDDLVLEDGYQPKWSVKDLLAHLACWMAEGAQALQRMRLDTYRREELDEDVMNARFWEACRHLDLHDVWAQLHSARGRMLEELDLLAEDRLDEHAASWFRDNGAHHYREHLPRLRAWLGELAAR